MCYALARWIHSLLNLFHAHLITLISDITRFDGVIIFGEYQNMLLHLWYQENGCMTVYGLTAPAAAAVEFQGSCTNRKKFPFHRITNQFAKHLSNFRFFRNLSLFLSSLFNFKEMSDPSVGKFSSSNRCSTFFFYDDVKCQFTALIGREREKNA